MATRAILLPVPVPGVRVTRWSTDELYASMKESYAIARIEVGRSEWWSRGKVWSCGPGSLQILQPGDVHRDISRDGPGTGQCVAFSAHMVESVIG